jgi:hypothetical protein
MSLVSDMVSRPIIGNVGPRRTIGMLGHRPQIGEWRYFREEGPPSKTSDA